MAELGGSWFEGISNTVRKKRTIRPRPAETQSFITTQEKSLSPLASPFDATTKLRCDDNGRAARNSVQKRRSRNHDRPEGEMRKNTLMQDGGQYANKANQNGFLINLSKGSNHKTNGDAQPITPDSGMEFENKPKSVKITVDGLTHMIQENAATKDELNGDCATEDLSLKGLRAFQKDITKDEHTCPRSHISCLQGNPGDFSAERNGSTMGRPARGRPSKQAEKSERVRKSKRAPNRRVLDLTQEGDEVDDEIRFLEKLRNSRSTNGHNDDEDDEESSRKHQKYSRVSEISMVSGNCSTVLESENQGATPVSGLKRNTTLTARQRALQSGRGGPSSPDANLEFPNGLQAAASKKKMDTLSEKELLKKAEAAQKRRLQNEKAAQKCQEEAIRKILSKESGKKKKEDQRRKRMEELAEEKAAEAIKHQSDTIRVVIAATGTIVSFGENCIPSIFTAKASCYPPPRESCAGPSCSNPFKYRDSKSKLPLCSLKCYKAVRERWDIESSS